QLDTDLVLRTLRPLFEDESIAKRAHNAKFHMVLLARQGVQVRGLAFDTMIAAYLLESGQRALALRDLAWAKVQVELPSVASLLGIGKKAITMAELPIAHCGSYACNEALLVERLVPILGQSSTRRRRQHSSATSRCRSCRSWPIWSEW